MDELYPTKAAEFRVALILDALKARYQQRHIETGITKALDTEPAGGFPLLAVRLGATPKFLQNGLLQKLPCMPATVGG
jgi:hypothetical protein